MEHWNRVPKELSVEDAVGQPAKKVSDAGTVDLNQSGSSNFFEEVAPTSTDRRGEQTHADNTIRLIEAKARLYIACIVLGALVLLIVCSFVAFLLRGDSSILSVVVGGVEGLVGAVIGYYFAKQEKRL